MYACLFACAVSLLVCSRLTSRWQCKLPSNVHHSDDFLTSVLGYAVGLLVCNRVDKLGAHLVMPSNAWIKQHDGGLLETCAYL